MKGYNNLHTIPGCLLITLLLSKFKRFFKIVTNLNNPYSSFAFEPWVLKYNKNHDGDRTTISAQNNCSTRETVLCSACGTGV